MAIKTVACFKGREVAAGSTAGSDPIEIGALVEAGQFALSYSVVPTRGIGSMGTCVFGYSVGPTYDGPFNTWTAAGAPIRIGTAGLSSTSNVVAFTPPIAPWMKINAVMGSSGSANVTAELHVL